jgi:cytochrome c-type biogenesis protein CcmH/NrfG
MSGIKTQFKRVTTMFRKGVNQVKALPRRTLLIGTAVAGVAVAGGYYVYTHGGMNFRPVEAARDVLAPIVPDRSMADLKSIIKANPQNGEALMELAHRQFVSKQKDVAIKTYDRALKVGAEQTETLYDDLTACFGTAEQNAASQLIIDHKLGSMAPHLRKMASNADYNVRWTAVYLLNQLKKAKTSDAVTAWVQDLNDKNCSVQKNAVVNLGKVGDKRALDAIRAADERDEKNNGAFFQVTCLGNAPEEAEQAILARK